jgi:hypothetical protein
LDNYIAAIKQMFPYLNTAAAQEFLRTIGPPGTRRMGRGAEEARGPAGFFIDLAEAMCLYADGRE